MKDFSFREDNYVLKKMSLLTYCVLKEIFKRGSFIVNFSKKMCVLLFDIIIFNIIHYYINIIIYYYCYNIAIPYR